MAPVQFGFPLSGCAALSEPCLGRAEKDRGVFEMFAAWQKRDWGWTSLQRSDCCFAEDHGRFKAIDQTVKEGIMKQDYWEEAEREINLK